MDFSINSHIGGYDNITSKLDFQVPGLNVKIDMTEVFSVIKDLILPNPKI